MAHGKGVWNFDRILWSSYLCLTELILTANAQIGILMLRLQLHWGSLMDTVPTDHHACPYGPDLHSLQCNK